MRFDKFTTKFQQAVSDAQSLAVGLLWGLIYPNAAAGIHIQMFFLACVIVAGIYGGLTVSKRIMFLQGGPALLGLVALLAA